MPRSRQTRLLDSNTFKKSGKESTKVREESCCEMKRNGVGKVKRRERELWRVKEIEIFGDWLCISSLQSLSLSLLSLNKQLRCGGNVLLLYFFRRVRSEVILVIWKKVLKTFIMSENSASCS